jgi:DNA mismatch repair protein MutL
MTDADDAPAQPPAIRQLDDSTVERIAAGEVVERPASVVKELVENSLDAGASRISVAVAEGGTAGITVTDDGLGMTATQAERAVEEHTTSKIRDVSDLEAGVGTLGFRGEALHAISAVSRLTLRTRPSGDPDATGTELVVEGGDVSAVRPAGCPAGTTIEVEDLFYNVPARRKYLKQASTEFAHVNTVVTSYALANPDVAISLSHDDRETFATTGQGNLREAVMAVYGRDVADAMVEVEAAEAGDGPLDSVTGLVSHPETNRAGRDYLSTYINGRYVRAGAVREAILDAYGSQLAPDRYPFAVLFLAVEPGTVDVNVHPRKMEVRFADEAGVRRQVHDAVETALLEAGLIRSGAPRGASAPEQTAIDPGQGDSPAARTANTHDQNSGVTDDVASPDREPQSPESTASTGTEPPDTRPTPSQRSTSEPGSGADGEQSSSGASADDPAAQLGTDGASDGELKTAPDQHDDRSKPDTPARFVGEESQARLGGAEPEQRFERLPALQVLGQLSETYIVAESPDGLVLIDQHAADERINYERLRERFHADTTTQALAEPVELELTAREAALFDARKAALERLGFQAEATGDRTVEVRAVPGLVADAAGPELIRDALGAMVSGEEAAGDTVEAVADELLADLACYPSVTGNVSLAAGSIQRLLSALDSCENPYACPHGRPVVIILSQAEIEDRFERDYPGHAGRRE